MTLARHEFPVALAQLQFNPWSMDITLAIFSEKEGEINSPIETEQIRIIFHSKYGPQIL